MRLLALSALSIVLVGAPSARGPAAVPIVFGTGAAGDGSGGAPSPAAIAFHRSSGTGVADIYVVNPDGSGLRRLTRTRNNFGPAWSPDGRRIAFASDRAGGSGASELYVMDADGGNVRRVTRSPRIARGWQSKYDVAWSPDGSRLVFVRYTVRPGTEEEDLFVVDVAGTGLRRLTATPKATEKFPAWSPDGTLIAFERKGGIWTMAPDGSGARRIVADGSQPAFSPDGGRILFADASGWIADIGADGRFRRNIVKGNGEPAWSPSGRRIVYQGPDGLYVINRDRTGRRRLTHPAPLRHDLAPTWQWRLAG